MLPVKKTLKKILFVLNTTVFFSLSLFGTNEQSLLKPGALSSWIVSNSLKLENKISQFKKFQKDNPLTTAISLFGGLHVANRILHSRTAGKIIPGLTRTTHAWDSFIVGSYGEPNGLLSQSGKWTGLLVNDLPAIMLAEGAINYVLASGFNMAPSEARPLLAPLAITYLLSQAVAKRQLLPTLGMPLGGSGEANLAESVYRSSSYIPKSPPRMSTAALINSCSEYGLQKVVRDMANNPKAGGRLLLTGESDLGKTFWAEQLANTLGRRTVTLNANNALYQGKFYGEVNDKFKALKNIAHHFGLEQGDVIIIDEIDSFILKDGSNHDEVLQTNTRKMVMDFLDEMTKDGYVVILISNKTETEIHSQVKNRMTRLEKEKTKQPNDLVAEFGEKAYETINTTMKTLEDLRETLFNAEIKYQKGFIPYPENRQKNFGWGLVEKKYPNLWARMQICDNIINAYQTQGNYCKIINQDEFTTYLAHATEGLTNGKIATLTKNILNANQNIDLSDSQIKTKIDEALNQFRTKKKETLQKAYESAHKKFQEAEEEFKNAEEKEKKAKQEKLEEKLSSLLIAQHNLTEYGEKQLNLSKDNIIDSSSHRAIDISNLTKYIKETLTNIKDHASLQNLNEPKKLNNASNITHCLGKNCNGQDIYNKAKELYRWGQGIENYDQEREEEDATTENLTNLVKSAIQAAVEKEISQLNENNRPEGILEKEELFTLLALHGDELDAFKVTLAKQYNRIKELKNNLVSIETSKTNIASTTKNIKNAEEKAQKLYLDYYAFVKPMNDWEIRATGRLYANKINNPDEFDKKVLNAFGVTQWQRALPSLLSNIALKKNLLSKLRKNTSNQINKIFRPEKFKRIAINSENLISLKLSENNITDDATMNAVIKHTDTMDLARAAAYALFIKKESKNIEEEESWSDTHETLKDQKIFFGPDKKLMIQDGEDDAIYFEHYLLTR